MVSPPGYLGILGCAFSAPALIALAGSTMYSVVLAATRRPHHTPKGNIVAAHFIVLLAASATGQITKPIAADLII